LAIYQDRTDAGTKLLLLLQEQNIATDNLFIAGIPNGGIPVALPIANYYDKPLYVMLARKIQYPWTTESGFGAITEDNSITFNDYAMQNMSKADIDGKIKQTKQELLVRKRLFKDYLLPADLSGMTVILIDDGLASGITMQASILSLKKRGVTSLIIAIPTAHIDSVNRINSLSQNDSEIQIQIFCPNVKDVSAFAVADAYRYWYDEITEKIVEILKKYNQKFF
jgi:predicted phosphoribosyltransferase